MTSIDPRLRQRRIAVRRAAGRRRLRILIAVVVLAAGFGGAYALSRSALLDLDTVEIDGAFGTEADQVAEASGLVIGTPMLDLDLDAANAAIVGLPWVETADVGRAWPGTVEIAVTRRIGVALLPVGDGSAVVIDDEAVAIARSETSAVGDLPVITLGPTGDLGDVQTLALPALDLIAAMPTDLSRGSRRSTSSTAASAHRCCRST
ncbi:MAG: FtsQ-type POTRA domain-containing protein [Actinomycetota bacterium]